MSEKPYYQKCRREYQSLSKRERRILYLYLVSRMNWVEISRELGVSKERIRQLKNRIFRKLDLDVAQEKKRTSLISIAEIYKRQRAYYLSHRDKKLAYSKRYRETHREEIRAKNRNWYSRNKDKAREQHKRDFQKHKEKRLAYIKAWQRAHPEKVRVWQRRYHQKHKERILTYKKAWQRAHPEKNRAWCKKYYYSHRDEILARQKARWEKRKREKIIV